MEFFDNDVMRRLLAQSLQTADLRDGRWVDVGTPPGSRAGEFIEWLTIANQQQSVVDDVSRIRNHPLVSPAIAIYGYIYDVTTGRLIEVPEATAIGSGTERQSLQVSP
jgi:carbonic anhydrase